MFFHQGGVVKMPPFLLALALVAVCRCYHTAADVCENSPPPSSSSLLQSRSSKAQVSKTLREEPGVAGGEVALERLQSSSSATAAASATVPPHVVGAGKEAARTGSEQRTPAAPALGQANVSRSHEKALEHGNASVPENAEHPPPSDARSSPVAAAASERRPGAISQHGGGNALAKVGGGAAGVEAGGAAHIAAEAGVGAQPPQGRTRFSRARQEAVRLLSQAVARLRTAAAGDTGIGPGPMVALFVGMILCLMFACLLAPSLCGSRDKEGRLANSLPVVQPPFVVSAQASRRQAPSRRPSVPAYGQSGPLGPPAGPKHSFIGTPSPGPAAAFSSGAPPGTGPAIHSTVSLAGPRDSQAEPDAGCYLCPGLVVPEECEVTLRVPRLDPQPTSQESTVDDTAKMPVFRVVYLLPPRAESPSVGPGSSSAQLKDDGSSSRCLVLSSSTDDHTVFASCRLGLNGALTILDASEQAFGLVRRRVGRAGYEVATRGGAQIHLSLNEENELSVTDRRNRCLALTESLRGNYSTRLLRIGPFVDAGLVTLAVLAVDLIESLPA